MCPNGITADDGEEALLPGADLNPDMFLNKCGRAVAFAKVLEADSDICSSLDMSQYYCCKSDLAVAKDPCPGEIFSPC